MNNILINQIPDFTTKDMQILKESVEGGKSLTRIKGPFIMCEQRNRNGRIYNKSIVEPELQRYVTELVNTNAAISELNHPSDPKKMFEVDLERGCHLTESLEWDGDNVIGTARILENLPMGRILKAYLDEGITLGVSTRASGSVDANNIVEKSFRLIAIDSVHIPSAQIAYVECIRENYDYIIGSDGDPLVESAVKEFENGLSASRLAVKEAFNEFISKIRTNHGI